MTDITVELQEQSDRMKQMLPTGEDLFDPDKVGYYAYCIAPLWLQMSWRDKVHGWPYGFDKYWEKKQK